MNRNDLTYWLFKDRIPVTKILILVNILTFLAIAIFRVQGVLHFLGFYSPTAIAMPWTAFTYPLVGMNDLIGLLFAGYWLWFAGGSLERSWGSTTFGVYFFLMSAISALGLFVGSILTGIPVTVAGLWLPIAGVTVAFAMLNPEQQILFMFVIPLKLKYLALLDAALVFVSYGMKSPILGVFALAGCAVSLWYIRSGWRAGYRPSSYSDDKIIRMRPRHGARRNLNPIKWYKDYQERKRLNNLFGK